MTNAVGAFAHWSGMVGPMDKASMSMVERVARGIAFSAGSAIVGPGLSQATREFGWKGDGAHFNQYVDAHWRECIHAATFALGATAAAISERWGEGHPGAVAIRAALEDAPP